MFIVLLIRSSTVLACALINLARDGINPLGNRWARRAGDLGPRLPALVAITRNPACQLLEQQPHRPSSHRGGKGLRARATCYNNLGVVCILGSSFVFLQGVRG